MIVGERLKAMDERKAFDEVVLALQLEDLLDRQIKTLSGGEL